MSLTARKARPPLPKKDAEPVTRHIPPIDAGRTYRRGKTGDDKALSRDDRLKVSSCTSLAQHCRNDAHMFTKSLLGSLPPEIWRLIELYILSFRDRVEAVEPPWYKSSNDFGERRVLSGLACVCRTLSEYLRPILFRSLTLNRQNDLYELRDIIETTPSKGLAENIRDLKLEYSAELPLPPSLPIPLLPSLDALKCDGGHVPLDSKSPLLPLGLRPRLSRLRNLRKLTLHRINLSSFPVFARLVGSIASLEVLDLWSVGWLQPPEFQLEDTSQPDCNSNFAKLQKVRCYRVECDWCFSWLFGAAATGHVQRRTGVRTRPVPPRDIAILVSIVKSLVYAGYHLDYELRKPCDEGTFCLESSSIDPLC